MAHGVNTAWEGGGQDLAAVLARLELTRIAPGTPSFVDALSSSLDWTQAGPLFAALRQPAGPAPGPTTARGPASAAVEEAWQTLEGLRRMLADLAPLGLGPTPTPAVPRPGGRTAAGADRQASALALDATDVRRHHSHRQQAMEAAVATLRERLRTALARHSPAAARLAAIDAVLERALAARETAALSALPLMAERLFERLDTSAAADRSRLEACGRELQRLLLAELNLRVQPVLGLLQALAGTTTPRPEDDILRAH